MDTRKRYAIAHPSISLLNARRHIDNIKKRIMTGIFLTGESITPIMWAIIDAAAAEKLPVFSILSDSAHKELKSNMPDLELHFGAPTGR